MKDRQILAQRLRATIRDYQRANRFIVTARSSSLTIAEIHLLYLVNDNPNHPLSDHVSWLKLSQPSLSRMKHDLMGRGLLVCSPCCIDSRRTLLAITPLGRQLLSDFDLDEEEFIAEHLKPLGRFGCKKFLELFTRFNYSLGCPPSREWTGIKRYSHQIGRFTRAASLITQNIFGCKSVSALTWHVLEALSHAQSGETKVGLSRYLSLPFNTVGDCVSKFIAKGLVTTHDVVGDHRAMAVKLSPAGERELHGIREQIAAFLVQGLQGFDSASATEFVELFETFCGVSEKKGKAKSTSTLVLHKLLTSEDIAHGRSILLEALLKPRRNASALPLSGYLLAPDSINLGVYDGETICGVIELRPATDGWQVVNIYLPPKMRARFSNAEILEAILMLGPPLSEGSVRLPEG